MTDRPNPESRAAPVDHSGLSAKRVIVGVVSAALAVTSGASWSVAALCASDAAAVVVIVWVWVTVHDLAVQGGLEAIGDVAAELLLEMDGSLLDHGVERESIAGGRWSSPRRPRRPVG